jgi:LAS superfamily LD-carboxypeptidase LdcB
MYAHPSFLRGRPEMLSQLKKCKTAAEKKHQGEQSKKKASSSDVTRLSKEPIQPVPLMEEGFTRAVSPSSGSDEDSFSRLKTIARHYGYGQTKPQQYTYLRDHVSNSMSRMQQQPQLTCQNLLKAVTVTKQSRPSTLAESSGKLNLLTLAVTCLAESGMSQSF